MKKLVFLFIVLLVSSMALAQSTAQINRIRGLKNGPVRTAFKAIATGTKTVSSVWTVSGDWIVSGDWTFNSIVDIDSVRADSVNTTKLTIGAAPTMAITAVDTFGAGRFAKITIGGAVYILWAEADSAAIID